jgi:hypothetical protein
MATKREVMLAGTAAKLAHMLASDQPAVVTPAGADQASATLLQANFVILEGATAAAQGVRLPPAAGQYLHVLRNSTGFAVNVYPSGTEHFGPPDSGLGGVPFLLNAATTGLMVPSRRQWLGMQGAGGGQTYPYLPLAGGTLTGPLTLAGDPASGLQAATKNYVDNKTWNVGAGLILTPGTNLSSWDNNQSTWDAGQSVWDMAPGGGPATLSAVGAGTVAVRTSSYTLSAAGIGRIFVSFNGAATITLAAAMLVIGQEVVVMDRSGACGVPSPSTNVITVLPGGSANIDNQPSAIINTAYGRLRLIFDGTNFGVA